jgi:Tfp pilus assembly protein PilN
MIEINLLPGQKKKKKAGGGISMPDFGELTQSVKDPLLLATVVAWVLAGAFIGTIWFLQTNELAQLEPELRQAQADARQFTTMIVEKRNMERLRDSLILELEAIREIDADRYVWPHIMDEVTRNLPAFTWLVTLDNIAAPPPVDAESGEVADPPVRFSVEGRTADIQAYTRYVRQLGESPWIADIQLGPTQTVTEQDRSVTSFSVQGTYQQADSAFIRTAPVAGVGGR